MKNFALSLGLAWVVSLNAHADPQPSNDILKCWDQSFAYTYLTIAPNEGNPDTLMDVELKSENQARFSGVLPQNHLGWGNVAIDFFLSKSECRIDPDHPTHLNCETRRGMIYTSYDESEVVSKTLRQVIQDLKFSTSVTGDGLQTTLSFTTADDPTPRAIVLDFPTDGSCL